MSYRHYLIIILILDIPGVVYATNWFQTPSQQAQQAFQQQNYQQAAELFDDSYRKGVALYRAGQYAEAAKAFAATTRPEVQLDAWYNLGNAYFKQGKYQEAIQAYEKVLAQQAQQKEAKLNLELAKQQLAKSSPQSNQSTTGDDSKGEQSKGDSTKGNSSPSQAGNKAPSSSASQSQEASSMPDHQQSQASQANNAAQQTGDNQQTSAMANSQSTPLSPGENTTQSSASATPDPQLFAKDKAKQDDDRVKDNQNSANMMAEESSKPSKEKSSESAKIAEAHSTTNAADQTSQPNSKGNQPPIGIPSGATTARAEVPTETETLANVLLDRIKDEPRQLLKAQLYIDAYQAKQNGDKTEKPW